MFHELGAPSQIRSRTDDSLISIDFKYEILLTGGDVPYWAARPVKLTAKAIFEADFPKYPHALIFVESIPGRKSTTAEIWQAGVAIPAETAGSKDYALQLGEGVAAAMAIQFSDATRGLIRERISPPRVFGLPD